MKRKLVVYVVAAVCAAGSAGTYVGHKLVVRAHHAAGTTIIASDDGWYDFDHNAIQGGEPNGWFDFESGPPQNS